MSPAGPVPTGPTPAVPNLPPTLPTAPPLQQRGGPRATNPGPDRTSGGLVKRSPRPTTGAQPALRPSEDLLQTLATYTTQLHRQINPNRPPTPPGGAPSAFPAFNPTPPPGTPMVRPGFPPQGGPAAPPLRPQPHATPTMHSGNVGTAPDHTASGLARRVRGAQMPQTQPVGVRRPPTPPPPEPPRGPIPAAPPPPGPVDNRRHGGIGDDAAPAGGVSSSDAKAETRSAKDVYSFLSSFSAGVQRGLDEARGDSTTSEEDK
jgi:hypothetical protein